MKTPKLIMTAGVLTAFSLGLGPDVFSQPQQPQQQQQQQPGMQHQQPAMEQFEGLRATDLQGSRVVNTEGDRLGTIDDLAVKMEDGILSYAIVSAGGFLGIGGSLRPVPPEALQAREVTIGYEIVLDVTEDQWDRAPTIEREQIFQLDQEARGQQLYQFYGQDWEARQERVSEFAGPDREPQDSHAEGEIDTQQIEQQLTQAMTQAGVDQQQAEQEAQRLAQQFSQEKPDQQEIEQELEQALTQAGVDQQQAQQEAQRLSQQVHQQIEFGAPAHQREPMLDQGERGIQDQQQQIEQQLTQAMTQAGVNQQQAQQEAQRLAQQFTQEKPDQQEIEQELEQALTQAGVDQQQAQQAAQRLSQQVHQQIEFGAPGSDIQQQQQQPGTQPAPRASQNDQTGLFGPEALRQTDEINLASDLMDVRIEDQRGERLGEISDLLVDLGQGRVGFALISSQAGFWEMGDAEFAVSPRAFEVRDNWLILNITPQDLEVAQLLTQQQLQQQVEQQARISVDEARQSPKVFRYQENGTAPGVFGEPGREREVTPERPEPGPPAQQDGQHQAPGQY